MLLHIEIKSTPLCNNNPFLNTGVVRTTVSINLLHSSLVQNRSRKSITEAPLDSSHSTYNKEEH